MQIGEYVKNRYMVEIIRQICATRSIALTSLSDDWLLELQSSGKTYRILGYKFSLNDAVASSIAGDKVAAHLLLKKANLPSVEHVLLRLPIIEAQQSLLNEWQKFVVKPLDGSGGHGVKLFHDSVEAVEWIASTGYPAWAGSPFISIKRELRFVLLDQEPLIVYEKQPVTIGGLKMFNLGMGAAPKEYSPDTETLLLAGKAQQALGLRLSAVDIIETEGGDMMVLEVNSGFMMEHYIQHSADNYSRAFAAYERIIDALLR